MRDPRDVSGPFCPLLTITSSVFYCTAPIASWTQLTSCSARGLACGSLQSTRDDHATTCSVPGGWLSRSRCGIGQGQWFGVKSSVKNFIPRERAECEQFRYGIINLAAACVLLLYWPTVGREMKADVDGGWKIEMQHTVVKGKPNPCARPTRTR